MARPARRLGNLPAETSTFIGRHKELAELRKKLGEARLVSLVGPGGVGKSRLAIRMATDLNRRFADGTWWVELAELGDPVLVSDAIMAALDLRDQATKEPMTLLLDYIRNKELLLVLDNCEQLLPEAAEVVSALLAASPTLRVIATTREPLSATGEHVMPVPPLELPAADGGEPLTVVRQNEAVMLFEERAAAASGRFVLDAANRPAVVELCRRLDGLPLAIELAAVRTRVLTVQQINDRLTDRFGLLTGGTRAALPRHQTLRTTIDWSHELLTSPERALLRRLCVFAGRFTLEDVEGVCLDDGAVGQGLDLISSLVEKSLVMKEEVAGVACYRLHETMREYAQLKLREAGEAEEFEDRFVEFYRSIGLQRMPEARYHLKERLRWAELEIDNIRAVLRWCVTHGDYSRGIDVTVALGWYWITHATTEGLRWLDELSPGRGSPLAQGWAYFLRGFLALLKADPMRSQPALAEAVAFARETGQQPILSQSLSMASVVEMMVGNLPLASRLLEEAAITAGDPPDLASLVAVYQARSLNGLAQGDLDTVRAAASAGERLSRQVGDLYSLQMMLNNLALTDMFAGELGSVKPRLTEALRIARQLDDRVALYYVLYLLACHGAAQGDARYAAQLMGAADTIRAEAGARLLPILPPLLAQAEASAAAAIGQPAFTRELEKGKQLRRDAAVKLALGEGVAASAQGLSDGQAGTLRKREAEVARLIAEGMSNKQIGARLFISERTVDSHVRSILNKLGVNSRAQIAGWVTRSQANT